MKAMEEIFEKYAPDMYMKIEENKINRKTLHILRSSKSNQKGNLTEDMVSKKR